MSSRDPWLGALLGGRYRLSSVLGRGGMGTVYEGVQEDLGRRVAIKVLHASLASDAAWVKRLQREARAAAALDHPGIVQVTDFQVTPEGVPFLVMERLVGSSLREVIDREGPLPPERAVSIAVQMLAALGAAHRAGLVHRDVKPDNVFLVASPAVRDLVKLLDFGIAKAHEEGSTAVESRRGWVVGTDGYMAPEQASGERVDARADIYSVGACIYEALSGRFASDDARTAGVTGAPGSSGARVPLRERRPELDPRLLSVVECALDPVPARRFESAEAMIAALRELATAPAPAPSRPSEPVAARTSPPTAVLPRMSPRTQPLTPPLAPLLPANAPRHASLVAPPAQAPRANVAAIVIGGVVALGALAGIVAWWLFASPPAPEPAVASTPPAAPPTAPVTTPPPEPSALALREPMPRSVPRPVTTPAAPRAPLVRDAGAVSPPPPGIPGWRAECGGVAGNHRFDPPLHLVSIRYSDTGGKGEIPPPPDVRRFVEQEVRGAFAECYRKCPPLTKANELESIQFNLYKDGHIDSTTQLVVTGTSRADCIEKALRSTRASGCPENLCTVAVTMRGSYE